MANPFIAAIDTPLNLLSESKAFENALLISMAASFPPSWNTLRSAPAEKNFSPCPVITKEKISSS